MRNHRRSILAPLPVRLAWGAGLAMLGLGFAGVMGLYGRCYIARMGWDDRRRELHLETLGWLGRRRQALPLTELVGAGEQRNGLFGGALGDLLPPASLRVNAPWSTLHLAGRLLPLILDAHGTVLDHRRYYRVLLTGRRRSAPQAG